MESDRTQSVLGQENQEEESEINLSNQDLKELVLSRGLEVKTYNELIQERADRKEQFEENHEKLTESDVRKWMAKHGKKHLIKFDDKVIQTKTLKYKERYKLKQFFKSLDGDGSGSIGVDELVEPFISLGIAETVEEVQKIIDSVDDDGSGMIEFGEFLKIIGSQDTGDSAGIVAFFKGLIGGNLADGQISNKLPFNLIISTVRRRKMLDAIMADKKEPKKDAGAKVMNAYARYLSVKKQKDLNQTQTSDLSKSSKGNKSIGSKDVKGKTSRIPTQNSLN